MKRYIDLEKVSDGKLYDAKDMAKLGCQECAGCSACCRGMGESIVLDPMDIYRITSGLGCNFEELLNGELELHVVDGIILPNLKMNDAECCSFLNAEGRCSIHKYRPGICRIFPLGRYYENHDFKYFLQKEECAKKNRTKIKIEKWVDMPDHERYKKYLITWHYFLNDIEDLMNRTKDDAFNKQCCMLILRLFYMTPYDGEKDFYEQFDERIEKINKVLSGEI